MGSELPKPPEGWPKYLREGLQKQDPKTLQEIAEYADDLALAKIETAEAELEKEGVDQEELAEEWDEDDWEKELDEAYEKADIPQGKGSITVNVIDGRGYYYLKWSEEGEFKSQYIAPVEPKERGSN